MAIRADCRDGSIEEAEELLILALMALDEEFPCVTRTIALIDEASRVLDDPRAPSVNQHRGMLKFNEVIPYIDLGTVPAGLVDGIAYWREMTPAERIRVGRVDDAPLQFNYPLDFEEVRDWIDLMTVPDELQW